MRRARRGRGAGPGQAPRGRTPSSARWLRRQARDPFVAEARRRGLRSRAAFKLLGLDDRFGFLGPGKRVVDLGAAPGGWTQVAAERVAPGGRVVALDAAAMDPVPGVRILCGEIGDAAVVTRLAGALDGPADVVLSDLAAPATGHKATDHLRAVALAEAALAVAERLLAPGGVFVAKVFHGGSDGALLARMKRRFAHVRHAKPPASRAGSGEVYVVARGFRGGAD